MEYNEAVDLLEVYTLEELLEYNGLTEADLICACVELGVIELPEPKPLRL